MADRFAFGLRLSQDRALAAMCRRGLHHADDDRHRPRWQRRANEHSRLLHAALASFSAMAASARKISSAPLMRSSAVSHSSKNTTFISGRTLAPIACLLI